MTGSIGLPFFRGPPPHFGRGARPFADFPIPPVPRPVAGNVTPRIIIPHLIDLTTWAHAMIDAFPQSQLPALTDEREWQRWGEIVVSRSAFTRYGVPSPYAFSDWRIWAEAIILVLPYGT